MVLELVVLGVGALAAYVLGSWFPRVVAGWRGRGLGIESVPGPAWAAAAKVDTVVLDRWGTVTTGKLKVTTVDPLEPDHVRNLRWFAGALEHEAEGRLARAIARIAPRGKVTGFEQVPGRGVRGSVDRHPVRVGRPDWVGMAERNDLGVVVGVELDGRPLGYLVVGDELRKDARASIDRLAALGVTPVLVSDDTARNTEHLAESCGIERCHPETAPEKRARLVAELREQGHRVAFASSRPEDSEAQAGADLAVGGDGSVRLRDLDAGRIAALLSTARGVVAGSRLSGPLAMVPAVAGFGLTVLGLGSVVIAAICALACLVMAAAVGTVSVVRAENLSRT